MSSEPETLVPLSLAGDKKALQQILRGVEKQVYVLALRMLWNREDARDATQEILLKVATRLSTFQGKSKLSTWVYTIACHHLQDRKKSKAEQGIQSFEQFGDCLKTMGSEEPSPEARAFVEEVRVGCLAGMLTCLDRPQRLVVLLGEIFQLADGECAEVLGVTSEGFRQTLARARSQLYGFLGGQCGLVNTENTCRCAKKTNAFIAAGIVDRQEMRFVADHLSAQRRKALAINERMTPLLEGEMKTLFRDLPMGAYPDVVSAIGEELFG